jgi:hypothetical protein
MDCQLVLSSPSESAVDKGLNIKIRPIERTDLIIRGTTLIVCLQTTYGIGIPAISALPVSATVNFTETAQE